MTFMSSVNRVNQKSNVTGGYLSWYMNTGAVVTIGGILSKRCFPLPSPSSTCGTHVFCTTIHAGYHLFTYVSHLCGKAEYYWTLFTLTCFNIRCDMQSSGNTTSKDVFRNPFSFFRLRFILSNPYWQDDYIPLKCGCAFMRIHSVTVRSVKYTNIV